MSEAYIMDSNSKQITEIETDEGTLYVDTETKESVLVEDEQDITSVSVGGGTLYIDTSTRESILVEEDEDMGEVDSDTAVV